MAEWCEKHSVEVWAYCPMPNHVHIVAVPSSEESLRRAIGEAHRRYTRHVNFREDWRRHLWQGRFHSFPMDERYWLTVARYIALNPVRANLVAQPEDYLGAVLMPIYQAEMTYLLRLHLCLKWLTIGRILKAAIEEKTLNEIRRHARDGPWVTAALWRYWRLPPAGHYTGASPVRRLRAGIVKYSVHGIRNLRRIQHIRNFQKRTPFPNPYAQLGTTRA